MSGFLRRAIEQRNYLRNPDRWILRAFGSNDVTSGVEVNTESAITWTALASGIRLVAETIAALPLQLYKRLDRGRTVRRDHPLYRILHDSPNPEMTSFEFRELAETHISLWGNSYSQIVRTNGGEVTELWPLNPDRVQMERDPKTSKIRYRIQLPNEPGGVPREQVILPASEVFHLHGWSLNGLIGLSNVEIFRETIGLGIATEQFSARFYGQGMNAAGVLEVPGHMSPEAYQRLKTSFEHAHGGLTKAHRAILLEEGTTWKQTTVDPEKAQFLGLRKFNVTEAARILRVPPHMLYDLERATFSNIEEQGIELVVYTLMPRVKRWEQRIWLQLLSEREQNRHFAEFNMDGLLRGRTPERFEAYASAITNGWMSPNEVRELQNLNPYDGGDEYLVQGAMVPVERLLEEPEVPPSNTQQGAENE